MGAAHDASRKMMKKSGDKLVSIAHRVGSLKVVCASCIKVAHYARPF
jgi:thymidine kinase